MPVIWKIQNGKAKLFFPMKGDAAKERRSRDWPGSVEKVVVKGREQICEMLNEAAGEEAGEDESCEFL